MGRLLRVLIGFVAACLVAGFVKVLFVLTPAEIVSLPPDVAADRISKAFDMGLGAAVQSALFSAPFALVAAAIGEWRHIQSLTYYALIGLVIALIGFLAQHSIELPGQPTIVNNYALTAFTSAGFLAGLFYWLFSGRSAGGKGAPLRPDTDSRNPATTGASKPTRV